MSLTEEEKNRRTAAAELLDQLNDPMTPLERKIGITDAMLHVRPEAFIQVAKIHLKATAYPKYQD